MKQFSSELYNVGREVARLEKSYKEITGSTVAANKEFAFLRDVAAELGQNFYTLADTYKGFLAASRGTTLAGKETREIFVGITKAGASLGLTSEQLRGSLYAVQQMMSKGKVQAEELRGQLGERLPIAFNVAAEAMGKSAAELNKMLDDGKLLAEDLLPKMAKILNERYTGEVDAATRASNEFEEAWKDLKKEMAESGFLDSVAGAISDIASIIKDESFKNGMREFARLFGETVGKIADLALNYYDFKKSIDLLREYDKLAQAGKLPYGLNLTMDKESFEREVMIAIGDQSNKHFKIEIGAEPDKKSINNTAETIASTLQHKIDEALDFDFNKIMGLDKFEKAIRDFNASKMAKVDSRANNLYESLFGGDAALYAIEDLNTTLSVSVNTIDQLGESTHKVSRALKDFFDDLDNAERQLYESIEAANKAFENSVDNLNAGLRSIQNLSESGTRAYAAMEVAANALNAVLAISAVLNQAQGDPYTAFARMAAMAAAVIALGQSVGNFNSMGAAEQKGPEASPTTGTILGDASAASKSITNSFDLLNEWNDLQYNELRGIHDEVRNLNRSLTAVATALVRSVGQFNEDLFSGIKFGDTPAFEKDMLFASMFSGSPHHMNAWLTENLFGYSDTFTQLGQTIPSVVGDIAGWALGGILGGDKKTELHQAGIEIGSTSIGEILDGFMAGVQQYAIIKETVSGGWFGSDKTNWKKIYDSVNGDTTALFNQVYAGIAQSLVALAGAFEVPLDVIRAYEIEMQRIDLKGLSGAEIQERLTEWASTILDTAVSALFGEILSEFQRIDEGMFETAQRIILDLAVVQSSLESIGVSFKAVGIEAYRATEYLIELAGGLEEFTDNIQSYREKFFTEGELNQQLFADFKEQFENLGLSWFPETREEFRGLVEFFGNLPQYPKANEQVLEFFTALLELADMADAYYTAMEKISESISDTIGSLSQMVVPLTEYEQTVQTITNLVEDASQTWIDNGMAVDEATSAAQSMINYFVGAVTAMDEAKIIAENAQAALEGIQAYRESLSSSAYSNLRPDEVFYNALEAFRTGDLSDLPTLADTLLEAARGALANPQDYQRVFEEVVNRLADAEIEAQEQVDMAAIQVSILEEQVALLQNVDLSLENIVELLSSFGTGGFDGGGISTGPASGHLETLHGTEAVIPLSGGAIPVRVYGGGDPETRALIGSLLAEVRESRAQNRKLYNMLDQITGGESSFQTRTAE